MEPFGSSTENNHLIFHHYSATHWAAVDRPLMDAVPGMSGVIRRLQLNLLMHKALGWIDA